VIDYKDSRGEADLFRCGQLVRKRKLRRCFTPGVNGAKQKLKWRGMLAFKPGLSSLLFTYPCLTALLLHGASSPQMSMSRDIFS